MKELTILNINNCHTFDNVYFELKQFWKNNVITNEYYNIVLTITIRRSNNTSFILIKSFPVKITEFDVYLEFLKNRLSMLNTHMLYSITFSFSYYKRIKYFYSSIIAIMVFLVIIVFIYFSIFIPISQETIETVSDTPFITISDNSFFNKREKYNVFDPFINIFNQKNSTCKYFPSYFVNSCFNLANLSVNQSDLSIEGDASFNVINYKDYFVVVYHNNSYYHLINDLYDIVSEYIQLQNNRGF